MASRSADYMQQEKWPDSAVVECTVIVHSKGLSLADVSSLVELLVAPQQRRSFERQNDYSMNTFYFAVAAAISVASIANGQATREPNCNYERCALGLAPVWNGLAITRGEEQRKV